MISDLDFKSNENMVIPLPKINTSILEKVVQWCDYCANINKTETKIFLDLDFLDLSWIHTILYVHTHPQIQTIQKTKNSLESKNLLAIKLIRELIFMIFYPDVVSILYSC